MNILGKITIHKPSSSTLVIYREPGILFGLFMLSYLGVVTFINLGFIAILWEFLLPRTLTCKQQQQIINCEYVIPGPINGKTIKIPHTKKAIVSQKPNEETIVLTSSKPWMVLESTSNNIQNMQSINQGLARLNSGEKIWKLDMYASKNVIQSIMFFMMPLGLLLLLIGVTIIVHICFTKLELDVKANTVSIVKLGIFRSRLSLFNELRGADSEISGHLGILSEKFGIYGGDSSSRRNRYRIFRLLFIFRDPFIFYQQTSHNDGSEELIAAISSFIAEHKA
jgi:hypothetical protein